MILSLRKKAVDFDRIRDEVRSGIQVWRGEPPGLVDDEFASDPGDLGRGIYYTTKLGRAKAHAGPDNVTGLILQLDNPKVLDMDAAYVLADMYETVAGSDTEQRLENARELTEDMLAIGYDGLVAVRTDKEGTAIELEIVDYRPYK